jgi:hypothetical protein
VGAGEAAPDGVLDDTPFVVFEALADPTDKRDGRGVDVLIGLRVGIREGVASSVLSRDMVEPWRDGGFEPARLNGRELGLELPREAPGVIAVLQES